MVPTRPTETTTTRTGFGHNKLGDVHNVSVFQFCHLFNTECWKFSQKKNKWRNDGCAVVYIYLCRIRILDLFLLWKRSLEVDVCGYDGIGGMKLSKHIQFCFLENVFHLDFRSVCSPPKKKCVALMWAFPNKKSVLIKNSQPWTKKKLSWTWRLVIWKVREGDT